MTAADWDRLALPTPSYAPGSWECGQLGLWGSGKLGAQPRLAVESKPRSVWTPGQVSLARVAQRVSRESPVFSSECCQLVLGKGLHLLTLYWPDPFYFSKHVGTFSHP